MSRILVIEDEPGVQAVLARGLSLAGHSVVEAGDLASGELAWTRERPDLVVLDLMLPDGDGGQLLTRRRAAGDQTAVLLLTARDEQEVGQAAVAAASARLTKPFAYAELLAVVSRLLDERRIGNAG